MDWGIFKVTVTVHRSTEEGELLWDVAELGSEKAESREDSEFFVDPEQPEGESSQHQEGKDQAFPPIRHQDLDKDDSLERPAMRLAWSTEGENIAWKGNFLQQ